MWRVDNRLRSPVFSLELVVVQIEGTFGYRMPTIGQQDGSYIFSIDLTGQDFPPKVWSVKPQNTKRTGLCIVGGVPFTC